MGRQVEQWLSAEQEQILHTAIAPSPALGPNTKFSISFDGTGVPVRKRELVGRRGKQANGSARTREAKLGCVFTQVGLDKEGRPQRDPIVWALNGPVFLSVVPSLVPRADLDRALALNSVQFNMARLCGPMVAAALIGAIGVAGALNAAASQF